MQLLYLLSILFGIIFVNEIQVLLKLPVAYTKHVSLLCIILVLRFFENLFSSLVRYDVNL